MCRVFQYGWPRRRRANGAEYDARQLFVSFAHSLQVGERFLRSIFSLILVGLGKKEEKEATVQKIGLFKRCFHN